MFDSISALQKKVSYTLDSLVPGILRVLHESLVKIIVTSTPPAFGELEQTLTSVTS
ncbi:Agamous-like MADS-box protein AGL8 [Zea mays]|nr:Agamous-like MADS-box protein AGL8 [Zea mays]